MFKVAVTYRGPNRRRTVIGMKEAARQLGVSRQHLYLVLMGKRVSPRIESSLEVVTLTEPHAAPGGGRGASGIRADAGMSVAEGGEDRRGSGGGDGAMDAECALNLVREAADRVLGMRTRE